MPDDECRWKTTAELGASWGTLGGTHPLATPAEQVGINRRLRELAQARLSQLTQNRRDAARAAEYEYNGALVVENQRLRREVKDAKFMSLTHTIVTCAIIATLAIAHIIYCP